MRRFIALFLLLVVIAGSAEADKRRAVRHPAPPSVPAPLAVADSYSINQGGVLTIAAPGVLANDTLSGATLSSYGASTGAEQTTLGSSTQTTQGGALALTANGGFTYTPTSTFAGIDTFKYVIGNASGKSSATVTVDVRAVTTVSAVSDAYTTPPDTPLIVPVPGILLNDTLAGGSIASFGPRTGTEQTSLPAASTSSQGGVVQLRADGSFEYMPPPPSDDGYGNTRTFLGLDGFSYVLKSGAVSSTATVSVTVEVPRTGADFVVTTPGHYYAIEPLNGQNPVLELKRGKTYTFQISADPSHPFAILDAPAESVINNNITQGTLTFTVPDAARNYRYRCTTHSFGNVINTVP